MPSLGYLHVPNGTNPRASTRDPNPSREGLGTSPFVRAGAMRLPDATKREQNSSGGKDRLGNISKRGDRYLRSLFTTGALAVIRYAKIHGAKHRPWLTALLARRPTKVAAIALANKIARMAWAMMAKGERLQRTSRACGLNEITPGIRCSGPCGLSDRRIDRLCVTATGT